MTYYFNENMLFYRLVGYYKGLTIYIRTHIVN